jgi:hypothetical protein
MQAIVYRTIVGDLLAAVLVPSGTLRVARSRRVRHRTVLIDLFLV